MSLSIVPSSGGENKYQTFKFGEHEIRVIDRDGDAWFVASDSCKALNITNVGNALARLDADERDDIRLPDVTGRTQSIAIISESGLYSLILRSDKPEAKFFRKYVTSEILPTIRKTGSYQARELSPLDILKQQVALMEAQQAQIAEHNDRLIRLEANTQTTGEYFTVVGYFKYMHLPPPSQNLAQSIGQRATTLSNKRGVSIGKTTHEHWGEVNTYHKSILQEVIDQLNGGK